MPFTTKQKNMVLCVPWCIAPDEAVPFRAYVDELGRRGIRIEEL